MNRSQPIPILVAAHSAERGGAEYCLDTTLARLDRTRFAPATVFVWDGPMAEAERRRGGCVEIDRFAWWTMREPSLWYWKNLLGGGLPRVLRLARRIRRRGIRLVYTNTATLFEPALAARWAGVPHVWHVHEVMNAAHLGRCLLPLGTIRRLIGRLSERVVFESQAARNCCPEIGPEKARVVYNSVRLDGAPLPEPAAARCALGLPADAFIIAWIGRLSERKAPLLLAEALARMHAHRKSVAVVAGEGPLHAALAGRAKSLALGDRLRIVPFQDDVRPLLAAADVLALTSREESFGLVLAEAADCGRGAVATRTQGPAEIVVDGQTGLLVPPDDPPALAAALDRLADDPARCRALGQSAARRAAELFSAEANTRKIEAVFREVLE